MPGEDEILDNSAVEVSDEEEPVVDQQQDEEVEASEPDKKMVDYRALQEERGKRKERDAELARTREQMELMRLQMMRLQEYASQNQGGNGQNNLANLDPEIQKGLAPYLEPIQRELQQAKQLLLLQAQKAEALEAVSEIERRHPDLDDYRDDIKEYLDDLSDHEKNVVLSSAKLTSKMIDQIKAAKKSSASSTAQRVVNGRAKSESGQSNNRTVPKAAWQDMKSGSKELQDYMRGLGWDI